MADAKTLGRLASALPEVAPKRHFHLDGFAVAGRNFVNLSKDGTEAMVHTDGETAAALVAGHPGTVAFLRRNDKPIAGCASRWPGRARRCWTRR